MIPSSLLRTLVILYWATGSLDVATSLALRDSLPAPLAAWVADAGATAATGEWLLRGWMLALLIGLIAGSLGIYKLESWGRWCFAVANGAMFVSYPLLEAMVYTWFGGLFADLAMVLTGAILLAAFAVDPAPQRRRSTGGESGDG